MIVSGFILQANVITIVNYNRNTFIKQATGVTRHPYQNHDDKKLLVLYFIEYSAPSFYNFT
jgi:hypothetical protein